MSKLWDKGLVGQLTSTIRGIFEMLNTDLENRDERILANTRNIGRLKGSVENIMRLNEQLEADIKELRSKMSAHVHSMPGRGHFDAVDGDLVTLADRVQALEDKKKHKEFCGNCGQTTCKCIEEAAAEAYIGNTIAKHLGLSEEEADGS